MDGPGHAKCIIVEGRLLARVCEHESQADKVTSNTSKTSYFLLTTSSVVGAEGGERVLRFLDGFLHYQLVGD